MGGEDDRPLNRGDVGERRPAKLPTSTGRFSVVATVT